jgi:Leucine rich repeat variant
MGAKQETKRKYEEARAFVDQLVLETQAVVEQQLADLTSEVDATKAVGEQTRATLRDAVDEAMRSSARLKSAIDETGIGCAALETAVGRSMTQVEALSALLDTQRDDLTRRIDTQIADITALRDAAATRIDTQIADITALRDAAATRLEAQDAEITAIGDAGATRLAAAIDVATARVERQAEEHLGALRDAYELALGRLNVEAERATPVPLEPEAMEAVEAPPSAATPDPEPEPEPDPEPEPEPMPIDGATPSSAVAMAFIAPEPLTLVSTCEPDPTTPRQGPIELQVSRAHLLASLHQLARSAADGWIRIEPVHRLSHGQAVSSLRLTAHDVNGGWEHHDLPASTPSAGRPTTTVDAKELLQAIELAPSARNDLTVTLDGDITVGAVLVLGRGAHMEIPSGERRRVESVELRECGRDGVVLETLLGRLVVPSRAATSLRSRRAAPIDLVTIGDRPFLSALVPGPTPEIIAVVVTPVSTGDVDGHEQSNERRESNDSPISQLLGALSATSGPDDLATIIANGVGYARRRAAAHPALPPGLIAAILRDGTEAMRIAAASNPSIPTSSIESAVTDTTPVVRAAVAKNPTVPAALLLRLARDDSAQVRANVARNPALTAEMLALLADDPDARVREGVAAHESCAVETLSSLARDSFPSVCAHVAANSSTPPELLDQLLSIVPEIVLANPHAPDRLLVAGSKAQTAALRAAVAANPSTSPRELQALARDTDRAVVTALASNPSAPRGTVRRARTRVERQDKRRDDSFESSA